MSYSLGITRGAQRALADLPVEVFGRISTAIAALAETPRPSGCIKLTGREAWRIRIGDYRVIYEVDDKQQTVTVVAIGHRGTIYR